MTSEAIGQWPLDRDFPALLTAEQFRIVFGNDRGPMSEATYHRRKALGCFKRFAVDETVDGVRYSGEKVRSFVRGEQFTQARTFGARRRVA